MVLRLSALAAGYGAKTVITDVSFALEPGQILAFLGHNGAGKTTTLKAVMGLLPLRAGDVTFDGKRIERLGVSERVAMGLRLLPEGRGIFPDLSVAENIDVVAARNAHLASQWLADQGFAVVVVDGRGTPGLGPEFERAVHGDLARPVLEDQVDALHAVAAQHPDLDLSRVGIRGWSFGGYLAALAVLRRPDVFHAAVAGAPVTDWSLYDTHYTQRYLGRRETGPEAYANLVKLYRGALDTHFTLEDQIAEGDRVVNRWSVRGRYDVNLTGITIHRIANGKILESWGNWDAEGLMQQLKAVRPQK